MLEQLSSLGIKTLVYSAGILSGLILAFFYYSATLYEEASVRQFVGKRKYIQGLFIALEYLLIPAVVVFGILSLAPQLATKMELYGLLLIMEVLIFADLILRLPKYDLEYYPFIQEKEEELNSINNYIESKWPNLTSDPISELFDPFLLVIANSISLLLVSMIVNSAAAEITFKSISVIFVALLAQLLVYSLSIVNAAFASRSEEEIELIMNEGKPVRGTLLSEGSWVLIRNENDEIEEVNTDAVQRIKYEERN